MKKYGQPEAIEVKSSEETKKIAQKQSEGKSIDEAIVESESEADSKSTSSHDLPERHWKSD